MTYSETTRPYAHLSVDQQIAALFSHAPLGAIEKDVMAHTVTPQTGRGRPSEYPPLLQLLVASTARLLGSQRRALKELAAGARWEDCCRRYADLIGQSVSLPAAPPTAAQQDHFTQRLSRSRPHLERLADELFEIAWGQAVHQGQFPRHTGEPDFAEPDPRHIVFGDGVYIRPFSSVKQWTDKSTGEIFVEGSRSKHGRPRVQREFTDPRLDRKTAVGINNVIVGTWTSAGRIVLLNDQVLIGRGNEATVALEMLRKLDKRGEGRLHGVVWDRIIHARQATDFFAVTGVPILTTPHPRTAKSSGGYQAARVSDYEAQRWFAQGSPLPLGTTAWQATKGIQVLRTKYYKMPKVEALKACSQTHHLWVDAGALWEVRSDEHGRLYKTTNATAVTSKRRVIRGEFRMSTTWNLPCPVAPGGRHEFTTTSPRQGDKTRASHALRALRPLAVTDARFQSIYGVRNNAESHNSWYQSQLSPQGRAARLDINAQYLDQLTAAIVVNALTWHTHLRQTRLDTAA